MVMAALVIVCILLIGTLAHLSLKRLKHWRKKRERSRNTPEEESDYENPNYSLGGNPCQYSSRVRKADIFFQFLKYGGK